MLEEMQEEKPKAKSMPAPQPTARPVIKSKDKQPQTRTPFLNTENQHPSTIKSSELQLEPEDENSWCKALHLRMQKIWRRLLFILKYSTANIENQRFLITLRRFFQKPIFIIKLLYHVIKIHYCWRSRLRSWITTTTLGISGFTPAGCPKSVPEAIAKRVAEEHAKGNPFQIGMFTGASTGDRLDGELARANAIKFRTPYQSNKDLRSALNAHKAHYYDMHLSELAQSLRYGFLPRFMTVGTL